MPRFKPRLERQAIGRGSTGTVVSAQLWAGLPIGRNGLPRWAVVLVKDNVIAPGGRTGTENEARQFFDHVSGHLDHYPLTEQQARDIFAEHGIGDAHCPGCAARLPIGGRFCTGCGRPGGVHMRGQEALPAPGSSSPALILAVFVP